MQKRKLIGDIINAAERAARQTQEMSCAVEPDAKDAACRCAKWYKKFLASARPETECCHSSLQNRGIVVHPARSEGIAQNCKCKSPNWARTTSIVSRPWVTFVSAV